MSESKAGIEKSKANRGHREAARDWMMKPRLRSQIRVQILAPPLTN